MFGRMIILKLAVGKISIIKKSRIWLNPHIFKQTESVGYYYYYYYYFFSNE